jgi:hypothetical protein
LDESKERLSPRGVSACDPTHLAKSGGRKLAPD